MKHLKSHEGEQKKKKKKLSWKVYGGGGEQENKLVPFFYFKIVKIGNHPMWALTEKKHTMVRLVNADLIQCAR